MLPTPMAPSGEWDQVGRPKALCSSAGKSLLQPNGAHRSLPEATGPCLAWCLVTAVLGLGLTCACRIVCCSAWSIGKKGELQEVACRKKAHGERVTAIALKGGLLYSGGLKGAAEWPAFAGQAGGRTALLLSACKGQA